MSTSLNRVTGQPEGPAMLAVVGLTAAGVLVLPTELGVAVPRALIPPAAARLNAASPAAADAAGCMTDAASVASMPGPAATAVAAGCEAAGPAAADAASVLPLDTPVSPKKLLLPFRLSLPAVDSSSASNWLLVKTGAGFAPSTLAGGLYSPSKAEAIKPAAAPAATVAPATRPALGEWDRMLLSSAAHS